MGQAVRFNVWRLMCALTVAVASGCAGGAWLESPIEAELPIEAPKHGYPTAVMDAGASKQAGGHISDEAPGPSLVPANEAQVPAHEARQQRLDRPQAHLTPLAVIPAELMRPPANGPAVGAANTIQHSAPGPGFAPANGHGVNQVVAGTAHPTGMPGIDVSGLDSLASFEVQPTATPAVVGGAHPPADGNTSAIEKVAHENSIQAEDRQVNLERAQRELIEALETEIRQRREKNSTDEELPRLEQQLRLWYLAAGRMEDAVTAVESLDGSQKEAYKNLMFGLGIWLSPDESRRAPLRTAKVLHSLRDATSDLAGASKLEVKNLALCEQVDQFGWYREFPRKEFQPKQQVILYAEVENFAAETKGPAGFETELQGSYVILDSSGQEMASRQLQLDKEICRNYRRDYFLAYRIYLPDDISPGRYRLELTVEDLKARGKYQGRKLGEGIIEFTIR